MRLNNIMLFLIVSLLLVGTVSATTYYADPVSGNDSNNGLTQSTAWKTIHNNIGTFNGLSNELILMDGVFDNESPTALGGFYTIAGYKITGLNKGSAEVILDSSFTWGFYPSGAQIILKDFNITANLSNNAIKLRGTSSNHYFSGLTIKDFGNGGITGYTANTNNMTITDCVFINNTHILTIGSDLVITNSSFNNNTVYIPTGGDLSSNLAETTIGEDFLTIKDNILYGPMEFTNMFLMENIFLLNEINYDTLQLLNMDFETPLVFEDMFFNKSFSAPSGGLRIFDFQNVSNIRFNNITFCSEDKWCQYDVPSAAYVFL